MNQIQYLNLKNIVEEIKHLTPYLEVEDLETYFLVKNNIQNIIAKSTQLVKDLED